MLSLKGEDDELLKLDQVDIVVGLTQEFRDKSYNKEKVNGKDELLMEQL